MNSPVELSLDMNLDSPSAAAEVVDGGSGDGIGMDCDDDANKTSSSTVGIMIHRAGNQSEGYHHGDNSSNDDGQHNVASFEKNSSFSAGSGYSGIDAANSNNANHGAGLTLLIEGWKDELFMMRVNNAILLDDLVKVGANV